MRRLFLIMVTMILLSGCVNNQDTDDLNAEIAVLSEKNSGLEEENEDLMIQLDNVERVYFSHYHFMETVNDCVYMILESGDSEADTLARKLVRYERYEDPLVIFESRGLDFRVSPNEKIIAIDHSEDHEDKVSFVDYKGELLYDLEFPQFEERLTPWLYGWSSDSRYFWGTMQYTYTVEYYFIVDTDTWEMTFVENAINYGHDKAINTDNGWLCYSDYPVCLDIQCKDDFIESGRAVKLWLYNIFTKEEIQIDNSVTKEFSPVWIDRNTVEYDAPMSEGRMRYVLGSDKTDVDVVESLSMIMDFKYTRMTDGDELYYSKSVEGLSDVEIINMWIDDLHDRGVNYGITESGENIFAVLKVSSMIEQDNQVDIDFNDVYLEFNKIGSQPGYFNNGLKYLVSQLTDAEVMNITIEGDDSRTIIHPDGLMIRDLWLK